MGTQFQRLTASRAWGPEAVQADSAWKLEAHHDVSHAQLQLPERIPEASSTRGRSKCVAKAAKNGSLAAPSLVPSIRPLGRPLPCCGFGTWNLLGPNPNSNLTPIRDPPPKPKPASIPNTAIDHLLAWALTSDLEGDHETAVTSALAVSLDRTLTLANAQSLWGPHSIV